MNSNELISLETKFGANNYKPLDVILEYGSGAWVTDVNGNKYLDCLAAYSAVNQGHCHPKIRKAMVDQAEKITLTSRAFRNDKLPLLYKKLNEMTGFEMFLPMNSGAEAVESAIKAVRKWAYKVKGVSENNAEIIVATSNFHGRTLSVVSFSTEEQYKSGFGPFTPGFKVAKYGDLKEIESLITNNTAGIMIEPIQGEAGIIIPPQGYLKGIREFCDKNKIAFICDEIQSGLGRSGKLFAYEYDDIKPDVVIIGKALSGGFYPVSAVLSSKEILGVFNPGDHGSTFGGNPLACAVAIAALEVIEDEKLVKNSYELGEYFISKLKEINSFKIIDVRGRGLWIGIELNENARPYCEKLMELGVLCKDTHETIIRVAPPLVITKEEIDWAVEKFKQVFK
jgi:ornithine--oxo-acid transaminase